MVRYPDSLCSMVQNLKAVSTRKINTFRNTAGCPVWQRNYYERVIRNEHELSRTREYIINNPMKWELDREKPGKLPVGGVKGGRTSKAGESPTRPYMPLHAELNSCVPSFPSPSFPVQWPWCNGHPAKWPDVDRGVNCVTMRKYLNKNLAWRLYRV